MGYIYARAIHAGRRKLSQVPTKYVKETIAAYKELYGIELELEH